MFHDIDILLVTGPLAGIWLGNRLTRNREVRQWRRDRCLEAYAEVLRTNEAVVHKATTLFLEESDIVAKRQDLIEQIAEFHRATQRAMLLAPIEMEEAFRALINHTEKGIAVKAGGFPKPSLDQWKKAVTTDIGAVTGKLFAMAQSDLAMHPSYPSILWNRMLGYLRRTHRPTAQGCDFPKASYPTPHR
jgi:hypothetical protein